MPSHSPQPHRKTFSELVSERERKLVVTMQKAVENKGRAGAKKVVRGRKGGATGGGGGGGGGGGKSPLKTTDLKPVNTIIQSLADMSHVTVEDLVKQLAGGSGKSDKSKKKVVVGNKAAAGAKKPRKSPERKGPAPPPKVATPTEKVAANSGGTSPLVSQINANLVHRGQVLATIREELAMPLLGTYLTRPDRAFVLSPTQNDTKTKASEPDRPAPPRTPAAVEAAPKPPRLVQATPTKLDTVVNSFKISTKSKSEMSNPQVTKRPTVGKDSDNTAAAPPTRLDNKTDLSNSVHDLKTQLIDKFNQRRMEEKAKADREKQPSQPADPSQQSVGSNSSQGLMNLGIGLKRSEMLEKEYQSLANTLTKKRYLQLKLKAEEVLRKDMTFAICGRYNGWPTVRKFFITRDWVERFATETEEKRYPLPSLSQPPDNDSMVLSRLTSRLPAKFVWTEINLNWSMIPTTMIVNKFPASIRPLSTKVGLLHHLNNQIWTYNPNYSFVKFPRSASLFDEEDMKHFSAQFRVNACICMLKNLVECHEQDREIISSNGSVPLDTIDFAVQRVCELETFHENTDLDIWHNSLISNDEWTLFLLRFQDIAHFGARFKQTADYNVPKLVACARLCLKHVKDYYPDIEVEGVRNLWIIKPSAASCGRGIRIFKSLLDIQNHCRAGFSFIAQKYIERPMIIYKTKFDIRQWFVVTSIHPLVIYLYDICYLRFCSKEFSLSNLHESVHLSNNSVQCRYSNMTTRSSELPSDNMWDSDTFLNYLRARKEDDRWYSVTLPGIRKGITGAFLASQDMLTHRNNSFNLYGADFMLTDDFVPWLIEINNGPCLRPTTSVTSRLCPMVIEDTVNLVLKLKHPATQDQLPTSPGHMTEVGRFKLIYSQHTHPPVGVHRNVDLVVSGKKAIVHYEKYLKERKKSDVAVPMFKDTVDHSPLGTYEHRSLKYEKIANYKSQAVSIVKTTTEDDTKRPPIPPGGVVASVPTEYRATL